MITKDNYDSILRMLLDNCSKEFTQTSEAEYLKQKRGQMDEDCKNLLKPDDQMFIEDCFDVLYEIERAKTRHAYQQGFSDCVGILKRIHVL